MLKKMDKGDYEEFWKEFSTNIKLGIMEDPTNRVRLAKLLRFHSSNDKVIFNILFLIRQLCHLIFFFHVQLAL